MINRVELIGNIGKDPEVKTVNGAKVARITVATTEKYTDKSGNKQEQTEWHTVDFWDKLAEIVEKWAAKGKQVYVTGKIQTKEYEKDGQKRYATTVRGFEFKLLGGKPAESTQAPKPQPAPAAAQEENDDLPF